MDYLLNKVNILNKLLLHLIFENPLRRAIVFYFIGIQFFIFFVQSRFPGFDATPQKVFWIPVQIGSCILISRLSPKKVSNPIEVLLVFNIVFLVIPVIATSFSNEMYTLGRVEILSVVFVLFNQLILFFLYSVFNNRNFKIKEISFDPNYLVRALICLTLILLFFVIYKLGLHSSSMSLTSVYVNRGNLKERLIIENTWALNYAVGWLNGLLIPLIIGLSISLKRYIAFAITCVLAILIYSQTFNKYVIASIFFVLLLNIIFQSKTIENLNATRIYVGFTWFIYVGAILKTITSNFDIGDFAIRRVLLDPSIMFQHYVRFSLEYDLNWWKDSRIFRSSPDSIAVANVVGERYFNIPEYLMLKPYPKMNATAGAAADGIAQGGVIGLITVSVAIFFFFLVLNSLSFRKNRKIVLLCSAIAAHVVMEGTVHTPMLSKGLIILPVLFYLLPKEQYSLAKDSRK